MWFCCCSCSVAKSCPTLCDPMERSMPRKRGWVFCFNYWSFPALCKFFVHFFPWELTIFLIIFKSLYERNTNHCIHSCCKRTFLICHILLGDLWNEKPVICTQDCHFLLSGAFFWVAFFRRPFHHQTMWIFPAFPLACYFILGIQIYNRSRTNNIAWCKLRI